MGLVPGLGNQCEMPSTVAALSMCSVSYTEDSATSDSTMKPN